MSKPIQITDVNGKLYVLCDDGSIYVRAMHHDHIGVEIGYAWVKLPPPQLEDPAIRKARDALRSGE